MRQLFEVFWKICLLRKGPQDLPHSGLLLGLALAAHIFMGVILILQGDDRIQDAYTAILGTLLTVVLLSVILQVARRGSRLIQALTALAGCEVIIGVFYLLLGALAIFLGEDADALALFWLGLLSWNIVVVGHILRHAINVNLPIGVVLSVLMTIVQYLVNDFLIH